MSRDREPAGTRGVWKVERAIVMQLLRDDRAQGWQASELAYELADFDFSLIERALARLEHEGVLQRAGTEIWASRAARCLDELELIGI